MLRIKLQTWASEGGGGLSPWTLKFLQKNIVFLVLNEKKNKFHHFWPPPGKFCKNFLEVPPGRNPPDTHDYKSLINNRLAGVGLPAEGEERQDVTCEDNEGSASSQIT